MITAKDVMKALQSLATKERAKASAWFFKTGKGQYGEGDVFIGVTVPNQRIVAKKFEDVSLSEIKKLLDSKIHEHRLTAILILTTKFKKGTDSKKKEIYNFYIKNIKCINNWDLVDASASYIAGTYLYDKNRTILYRLVKSKNMWERRIAIVATMYFISKGDFKDTIEISKLLISDKEDLLHKAVGWMLREVGKMDRGALVDFLNEYASKLPRTALRYSIEHFKESDRKKFMKMK
jgi:3-methyladenine DNA glycosylase AlkD